MKDPDSYGRTFGSSKSPDPGNKLGTKPRTQYAHQDAGGKAKGRRPGPVTNRRNPASRAGQPLKVGKNHGVSGGRAQDNPFRAVRA